MIISINRIYNDELLYSILGRYIKLSGCYNFSDNSKKIYGTSSVQPVVEFPCNLEALVSNFLWELNISSEDIIRKFTFFPLYSPFLSEKKISQLIDIMKYKDGKAFKQKLGAVGVSICKKNALHYCPLCTKEEFSKYGEAYFHRLHQVEGVLVCDVHKCLLKEYRPKDINSVHEYVALEEDKIDLELKYIKDKRLLNHLLDIAKEVKFLLDNYLDGLNKEVVRENYLKLIGGKGLLTLNKFVRQIDLGEDFTNYYGEEILEILESPIDKYNCDNWLQQITRKSKSLSHPIRNILFIKYLCGSIENFIFMINDKDRVANYEKYPCLNPVCKDYTKLVIDRFELTKSPHKGCRIGLFACQCGFIYTRDLASEDIYKLRSIRCYGGVWDSKLKELIGREVPTKSIGRELKCDYKTIILHADRLGLKDGLHTKVKLKYKSSDERVRYDKVNGEEYKKIIQKALLEEDIANIKGLKEKYLKQFCWLAKNERNWHNDNVISVMGRNKEYVPKVNYDEWKNKDAKILEELREAYKVIAAIEPPKRVTKTLLGRSANRLAYIGTNLNIMPECKEYLDKVCETVEDFQIRRVDYVCKRLKDKGEPLIGWKIRQLTSLTGSISYRVKERIDMWTIE